MSARIVLMPDHAARGFMDIVPGALNEHQTDFIFSLGEPPPSVGHRKSSFAVDIAEEMAFVARCKEAMELCPDDLLVRFTRAVLSARTHGLTNLFLAGSSLDEEPPRVAVISTRFIQNEILPADPNFSRQRHALYHLLVCSLLGAFLNMRAHQDRGCLLDFNSFTPNIHRKIDIGYSFCDDCFEHVEQHSLGDAVSAICGVLKAGPSPPARASHLTVTESVVGAISLGEGSIAIGRAVGRGRPPGSEEGR